MKSIIETESRTAPGRWQMLEAEWTLSGDRKLGFALDAVLQPDADAGGFVVTIAQLPGVASQGDDLASALQNIVEAFQGAIETYQAEGMPIPWRTPQPPAPNERRLRIVVPPCPNCP